MWNPSYNDKNYTQAGDENRTHVSSLEGWCSTIELRPQENLNIGVLLRSNASALSFAGTFSFALRIYSYEAKGESTLAK